MVEYRVVCCKPGGFIPVTDAELDRICKGTLVLFSQPEDNYVNLNVSKLVKDILHE